MGGTWQEFSEQGSDVVGIFSQKPVGTGDPSPASALLGLLVFLLT